MGEYRLSAEAECDLDGIWLYVARASGSIDAANRLIDAITECFDQLARHPRIGRTREDLKSGLRSFPAGNYVVIYRIEEGEIVAVLHVISGARDIATVLAYE